MLHKLLAPVYLIGEAWWLTMLLIQIFWQRHLLTVNGVLELGRQCVGLAGKWFEENNLVLNANKSFYVMFKTKRSSAQCPEYADLLLGKETLPP